MDSARKFKRVCVFCGSHPGYKKVFGDAAIELGSELVNRKIDLVYGGGNVGLMGLISQRVHDGGCHVLGVIPKALVPIEISGEPVGDVRIVSDMHERKAEMALEAEAFIALPGGYGEYCRRIWNYGRPIGNDNMGTTRNSQKTSEAVTLSLL